MVDRQAPTCDEEPGCGRRMGAAKITRHSWSDEKKCRGCNQRGRHREAQAVLLPVLEGGQKPDHRRTGEVGTEGQNVVGRLEVAKRNHDAPSE